MSITFNESTRIFTLNTAHSTYQMQADMHDYLLHLYYGARTAGEMGYLLSYADRGFSGNPYSAEMDRTYSLDALPQEYPSLGTGDFRNFALNIENADGSQCCDPVYVSHKITKGKYNLSGLPAVRARENEAETLEILLADPNTNMKIHLLYGVLEKEDIITRSVIIKNAGEASVTIRKAQSACLDFLHGDYDLIKFYGRHAMERNMERVPVSHGSIRLGSRRGTSSHQYNPGVILAQKNANEDSGSCYGMLLVYSGNFLCEAEKDQYNQTRLQMGLTDELFAYPLAPGAEFTAPEVILSYSNKGFSRLSQQYHHCIMNHICQGKYVHENRPILINSWEAAYFDFTGDTIVELAKQAKELGMDSLAITDHGVMYGVIDFYKAAKEAGIKPILGCEVYVAPGSRFEKTPGESEDRYYHLVLLAENNTGYQNLMKIVSRGFTEGFYYKPRVDYEVLTEYHEGIIALSACLAGEVQRYLARGMYEMGMEAAKRYENIFGKGNFFLELQDHGISTQQYVNQQLVRMSEELNIELVATNDIHYTYAEDADAHDILLCIQTGKMVTDENRMRYEGGQYYCKSPEEMAELFSYAPQAIENTYKIAQRCNVEIEFGLAGHST